MKNENGQATVEFALVILVLLMAFILPVVDFGRYLYTSTVVNDLSHKAARIVALDTTYNYDNTKVETLIDPILDVTVNISKTPRKSGEYVKVTVTYNEFDPITPFITNPVISYSSTIRVE